VKIVLTGGPHSGKTALLEEFARRGFTTVPEAAIGIIAGLVAELGTDGARAWRLAHVAEFQERIARAQLELEARAQQDIGAACFCDRGVLDGLAYSRLVGAPVLAALEQAVSSAHYDVAVLCEICLPFKPRVETGRTSDLERARQIEAQLGATYIEHGYELVRLPAVSPVAARADLLLAELGRRGRVLARRVARP
jgi:predicted ATPase